MAPSLEIDELELLAIIRKSPENWNPAWRYLWETYRESAKAVIQKFEKDELEQDEIFDKSLIIFRRKVLDGSFLEQSSVRTFIIGICIRICWQRYSRRKGLIVEMTEELQIFIEQSGSDNIDILEDLYTKEENETVNRVIQKIGKDCQQLLREYYWQKLSQKEMAANREMKGKSSIKNKLVKCRRKMEELLLADQRAKEVLDYKIAVLDQNVQIKYSKKKT